MLLSLALASLLNSADAAPADLQPIACGNCTQWNRAHAPFRLYGESYYVGTEALSAVLVNTPRGLVLFDGDLPQSVPQLLANIRSLGFKPEDLKLILVSHAHHDHVGGVAALQRLTGASVIASLAAARDLRRGRVGEDDPQAGFGDAMRFPPVAQVETVADGEVIEFGGARFRAHYTPGHTAGGVSWSWRSCVGEDCANLVYADSLNAVSAPGFRFSADEARVAYFRHSIDTVHDLACDLLVPVHPDFTSRFDLPKACATYADAAAARLDARLQDEAATAP